MAGSTRSPTRATSAGRSLHGKSALGGGGWFGVGLGASRQKWGWLPDAHTDFIFAVIGEELGLVGSLLVIALFAAIAYRRDPGRDGAPVTGSSASPPAWSSRGCSTQALLNLGAVLQLLPITGVPLPLVSYGGSSLVPTLVALGMLMSFARRRARPRPQRRASGRATACDLRSG